MPKTVNLFWIIAILIINGCGGGSSTPNSSSDNSNNYYQSIKGFVVDGELKNAIVFLDLNHNYKLDTNEPHTKTNSVGEFELELNDKALNSQSYKEHKAVIVAIGGTDIRTDKDFKDMLSALPEDYNKQVAVNSMTTLVTEWTLSEIEKIENSNKLDTKLIRKDYRQLVKDKLSDIYNQVSDIFNIRKEHIFINPYELIKSNKTDGLKVLKAELKLQQIAKITKKALKKELQKEKATIRYAFKAIAKGLKEIKKNAKSKGDKALIEAINIGLRDNRDFKKELIEEVTKKTKDLIETIDEAVTQNGDISQAVKNIDERTTQLQEDIDNTTISQNPIIENNNVTNNTDIIDNDNTTDNNMIYNNTNNSINNNVTNNTTENNDTNETVDNNVTNNITDTNNTNNSVDNNITNNTTDNNNTNETVDNNITNNTTDNNNTSNSVDNNVTNNIADNNNSDNNINNPPKDTTPPVITLNGDNPQIIILGNSYQEFNATAIDNKDGDVNVTVESNITDTKLGEYQVIYRAKDSDGNEANKTRVVKVVSPEILLNGYDVIDKKCNSWHNTKVDKFTFNNNTWGSNQVPQNQDWVQCVFKINDNGKIKGGYLWGWPNGKGGVKGYPEAIYGHKFGGNQNPESGWPKKVSELEDIYVDISYRDLNMTGWYNIAPEWWLHTDENLSMNNIKYEIMVRFDPIGMHQSTKWIEDVEIDGIIYDVYQEGRFFNFVTKEPIKSAKLHVNSFLDFLVNHGISDIPNLYYADFEMGTEVWYGSGMVIYDELNITQVNKINPQLDINDIINYNPKNRNLISNGSFELGVGVGPTYFGWRMKNITTNLTPPSKPEIDYTTSMEGNASLKLAHIKPNQIVYLDLTPVSLTEDEVHHSDDEDRVGTYQYADLKTDCPGKLSVWFTYQGAYPDTEWKRFRLKISRNSLYGYNRRRINVANDSDKECTLWMDGLTWTVNDIGEEKWIKQSPVEAVFLPTNGWADIHYANQDVKLHFRADFDSNLTNIVAELHLRDLTRDGNDTTVYMEYFDKNINIIDRLINLKHLKHGAYMAHLAFYKKDTKEIVGVAVERFTVMDNLENVPDLVDFVVGSHGSILTFGDNYFFSLRGSWDLDTFYKNSYQIGLRAQRLLIDVGKLIPNRGDYNSSFVRPAINYAAKHHCSTIFGMNPFKTKKLDADKPSGHPGDWIYDEGIDITDRLHTDKNEPYENLYKMPDEDMRDFYNQFVNEFKGKLFAIENVNELNLFYRSDSIGNAVEDLYKPIYNTIKYIEPNLPILFNITMDFYGGEFTAHFLEHNGTKYTDGFTYHPYSRTFIYYKTKDSGVEMPGIKFIKRNEKYRDTYSTDEKKLIMGMTEIHEIGTKSAVGWDIMQRVMLDWSGKSKFSSGIVWGGLYFLEYGNNQVWNEVYSRAPGVASVALNAMYSLLGGYKIVKRVDWSDPNNYGILINIFKKPNEDLYAVALAQGDFPNKRAVLNVTLPLDAKLYDQWGEEITRKEYDSLKLSNEILYIKTADSSILNLFDDENIISWSDEPNGYDYLFPYLEKFDKDGDSKWWMELLNSGIRPRVKRE